MTTNNNSIQDVHTEHCCLKHGCKYNDEDCTVTTKKAPQSFPCYDCREEQEERVANWNEQGNSNMLGKAIAIASTVHHPQKDKGGNAYILHPIRIMMRLRSNDEELMSIAILHDTVEDSEWTLKDLKEVGFSKRVTDALALLTHDPNDSYMEYIKKISTNADAVRVKLEDLRDNSDITRLKGLREKDIERMEKYHRAYLFLKGVQKSSEILESEYFE
jgi:hypothetical protein